MERQYPDAGNGESAERHATTFDHKFFLVVNLDVGLRHCYRGN
jgi:hypothetical protein